ncbi:hypothetical protein A1O3_00182 [Capronia epimyces CBS 606.96]|uniref:Integral membrane protein, Mpv17/PMP22 family n=1 Tax=Capronia epimyces CBS 606.96 TaxID=1182542 RepID=W9YFG9_9EURO|nr:uncharacterized protein A1O3_00182 [Capronia epimyces CBS 606.96]EXJ91632.1 hypothetical protein A1O3_00182 [Capronia epimyces CBS 606.96]
MSSRLLAVTVQGAAISALSNTLAQGFTVYRERSLSSIDPVSFLHFIILAVISTPLNYQWQLALENHFPSTFKKDTVALKKKEDGTTVQDESREQLSIPNTLAKFILDQTVGSALNTLYFVAMINVLKGAGWSQVLTALQRDFWPMLVAGYKFWPLVTLGNLVLVPVEQRMLVGGLAGLAWGIYVSLLDL